MMYCSDILMNSEKYTYEYFLQDDVCRLCWSKNAKHEITSIISENSTENEENTSFLNKLRFCVNIEVNSDQPKRLCSNCSEEIERFYNFKKFCCENDSKLKDILQKGFLESNNCNKDIKTEYNDADFNYTDNEDYIVAITDKKTSKNVKNNSKIRKKYSHKRSPTSCNICCLDLETKDKLSSHNSQLHGIEDGGALFRCFGCEKRFKSRKTRISHEVNFCKGLKDGYMCNICERYLPKRCMYEYHMRDHRHNIITELPEHIFRCQKCSKLFKTKELLRNHMTEHETEKNFVCDVCGRVFSRQDYLHKHKLTHAGIRRHQCPHCEFRATQRSSLTVHIRKHTGERPYSCDMCPQRCISSSNLRAHRRRHLGDKRYQCTICNKKFGYKISLEEHISSTHVHSEAHPCEQCGATYTRIRGLRRHLAAKHGKQKKEQTLPEVTEPDKIELGGGAVVLKNVEYVLKDSDNVLLLKHQDGDVYMV